MKHIIKSLFLVFSTASVAQDVNFDSNNDGCIGNEDLLSFLSAYGNCSSSTSTCGEVVSFHGYEYGTVEIGGQCWFAENLKTTKYADGSTIPGIANSSEWSSTTEGAWSALNNNLTIETGFFYNGFAVLDERNVCPTGWSVPTEDDWIELGNILGGTILAGGLLKQSGTNSDGSGSTWSAPNLGAEDAVGFTGKAGSFRRNDGCYCGLGYALGSYFYDYGGGGYWWSRSINESGTSMPYMTLWYNSQAMNLWNLHPQWGLSVRCLKDE